MTEEFAEQIEKVAVSVHVNIAIAIYFNIFLWCWMYTLTNVSWAYKKAVFWSCVGRKELVLGREEVWHSSRLLCLVNEAP